MLISFFSHECGTKTAIFYYEDPKKTGGIPRFSEHTYNFNGPAAFTLTNIALPGM